MINFMLFILPQLRKKIQTKIRLLAWERMEKDGFLEEEVLHRNNDCSLTKRRGGSFVKGL